VLERVVGDVTLPEDVSVIAAANPPEQAAGGWDLSAPLANRFCHLEWPVDTDRYLDFCASALPRFDEIVLDWVSSGDFDRLLVATVRSVYPAHEQDQFIGHLRGLVGLWVRDQTG